MKSYIIGRANPAMFYNIHAQANNSIDGMGGYIFVIEARVLHHMFMMSTCPVPEAELPDPDLEIAVYLEPSDNEDWMITWLVI